MPAQQTPATLATARGIASALIAGCCLFWLTGLWVVGRLGPVAPMPPATQLLLFELWLAVAIAGVGCAWLFRGRALRVVERAPRITEPAEADRALRDIQTWLLVAWALSEAPALFSGALLLMNGNTRIALAGVLALAIGMLGSFPRAAWFEPLQRIRDAGGRVGASR